jgi:hypothetical protein
MRSGSQNGQGQDPIMSLLGQWMATLLPLLSQQGQGQGGQPGSPMPFPEPLASLLRLLLRPQSTGALPAGDAMSAGFRNMIPGGFSKFAPLTMLLGLGGSNPTGLQPLTGKVAQRAPWSLQDTTPDVIPVAGGPKPGAYAPLQSNGPAQYPRSALKAPTPPKPPIPGKIGKVK